MGLCLVVLLPLSLPSAHAQSPEEQRLADVTARLAQVRRTIEAAERQSEQDAAALATAEQQLAAVRDAVSDAEQAAQRQQAAVVKARKHLDELLATERDLRQVLAHRAVTLYKRGQGLPELALLTSSNQLTERAAHLQGATHAQTAAVEQLTISQRSVDAQRERLQAEQLSLQRVLAERRKVLTQAESLRETRALAAASSRQNVEALAAREDILLADREGLEALATRASRLSGGPSRAARPQMGATAASSGSWAWPTAGPVTSEFGPRWRRMHEGIDIGAPTGAPIYAGSSGVVAFAGRRGGYGNLTLVDHGNGVVSAYAHQSRIGVTVGQQVTAGQVVGSVGATGNVTGPHLHYEVRVGGAARNPPGYLP